MFNNDVEVVRNDVILKRCQCCKRAVPVETLIVQYATFFCPECFSKAEGVEVDKNWLYFGF